MEQLAESTPIMVSGFAALTLGIVVYFLGASLTRRFPVLARYSIPEPVSGGLIVAFLALLAVLYTGREVSYDLTARDALLVYFFTTIGLNARLSDLRLGGRPLVIMLVLTIAFMVVQTIVGVFGASLFGSPPLAGLMMGAASLIGGHGTSIAWGPVMAGEYGIAGAAEPGIALATAGLILASLAGGPIANYLTRSRDLKPAPVDEPPATAAAPDPADDPENNHVNLMRALLWLHVAIGLGMTLYGLFEATGIKLPLFVPCLLSGIFLTSTVSNLLPGIAWPTCTKSLALISEFSLSVFRSMSLASMEPWTHPARSSGSEIAERHACRFC